MKSFQKPKNNNRILELYSLINISESSRCCGLSLSVCAAADLHTGSVASSQTAIAFCVEQMMIFKTNLKQIM